MSVAPVAFELPVRLEAREPPEARGLSRDEVRLMVARRESGTIEHSCFRDLPEFLEPGDLLVINNSATIPAAVPARDADGSRFELRLAGPAPRMGATGWWVVELRSPDGSQPVAARAGQRLELPGDATAAVVAPYAGGTRLWLARIRGSEPVRDYLWRYGRPVRYGYVAEDWALDAYQTVYATEPGSAEMPSAARPFSGELVARLAAHGVLMAPITLHAGLSSPERHEPPQPERYRVPEPTARLANAVRDWGSRVIAVGTTVVRALETVATPDGLVAGEGWTNVIITPERGAGAVDGLLTGWHEPAASHLQMLEAIAGPELLERSYESALENGYLWHEFGDSHLILP
ncbi:MAG: S-adenosylmethionine:tRNA ribosyltransferase-isomerase [Solirubrobacterales bacterium]